MVVRAQNTTGGCTTGHCLNWGVWWFAGPAGTGTVHVAASNFSSVVYQDFRSITAPGGTLSLSVTNYTGLWGWMQGADIGNSMAPQVPVAVRFTKGLFTSTPSWYFDVPSVATDTAPLSLFYTVTNTRTLVATCPTATAVTGRPVSGLMAGSSGGVAPLTFSVTGGELPPGLLLDSATGLIWGTPLLTGQFSFTLKVLDSTSQSATANCSILVGFAPRGGFRRVGIQAVEKWVNGPPQ
jgi:hypothetical protein